MHLVIFIGIGTGCLKKTEFSGYAGCDGCDGPMEGGRGFAGYQKRHGFSRGPMSHGSKNHRLPGSTGAGTTPGRVYPGKRMAGRMGGKKVTTRGLEILKIDNDQNLLVVKGSVPGKPGSLLNIRPAKRVGFSTTQQGGK